MLASCNASDDFSIPNKTGNNPNFLLKNAQARNFWRAPSPTYFLLGGLRSTLAAEPRQLTPSPVDCKEVLLELSLNTEQPRNASGQTNGHLFNNCLNHLSIKPTSWYEAEEETDRNNLRQIQSWSSRQAAHDA